MGRIKFTRNWKYYAQALYWGQQVYPMIERVTDTQVTFSKLSLMDRLLNWNARRKYRLIQHRWHKWINATPREDYPDISQVECKYCHIIAFEATRKGRS